MTSILLSLPPVSARPSPSCLQQLPAVEQWEHISLNPRFLRQWFSISLILDVLLVAVVYIWGWSAAGQPWIVSVPAFGHVAVVTGVLLAVQIHGPIPHATVLCPANTLLKLYIVICPFTQQVQNRPWGSASLHIISGTISTFLMHFASVVSTESWQVNTHRLLDARVDVALSGMAAVLRHLDNTTDMDAGIILLDQATSQACMSGLHRVCGTVWKLACIQLALGSIEMLVAVILSCGGKFMAGSNKHVQRFRVAVYTISLCCEVGLIFNQILTWRMLPHTTILSGSTLDDQALYSNGSGLAAGSAAHIAVASVLTVGVFAANMFGLRRALRSLAKLQAQVRQLVRPERGDNASTTSPPDVSVHEWRALMRAQTLHAWRSQEHASLCVNGSAHIADMAYAVTCDGSLRLSRGFSVSVAEAPHGGSTRISRTDSCKSASSRHLDFARPRGFQFLAQASELSTSYSTRPGCRGPESSPGSLLAQSCLASGTSHSRPAQDACVGTCMHADAGASGRGPASETGGSCPSQRSPVLPLREPDTTRAGIGRLQRFQNHSGCGWGHSVVTASPSAHVNLRRRQSGAGSLQGAAPMQLMERAVVGHGRGQRSASAGLASNVGSSATARLWDAGLSAKADAGMFSKMGRQSDCESMVSTSQRHGRATKPADATLDVVATEHHLNDATCWSMPGVTTPLRGNIPIQSASDKVTLASYASGASMELELGFIRDCGQHDINMPLEQPISLRHAAGMLVRSMWHVEQDQEEQMDHATQPPWSTTCEWHSHSLLSQHKPACAPPSWLTMSPHTGGDDICLQCLPHPGRASNGREENVLSTALSSHQENCVDLSSDHLSLPSTVNGGAPQQ